jgi:2-haloacid dehalogenase
MVILFSPDRSIMNHHNLSQRIQVITFDCYGTLIDWEAGAVEFMSHILRRANSPLPVGQLFERWEEIQFGYLRDPYELYREILFHSLLDTLDELKIPYRDGDGDHFGEAIGTWQPFADVPQGLARLKRKFKLGIISNIDQDILAQTLGTLGTGMDYIVTAERAGSYKPDPEPFRMALEEIALPPSSILHAAFGYKYDLQPAAAHGMATCFVNRSGMSLPPGCQPDLRVSSIGDLADQLGA